MKKLFFKYINSFSGLSKEVWWLALITLINRAGTMVIPFLSIYLTDSLCFTLKDVGWIMSSFGAGSLIGTWLGGKLTDKIGYYKVMVISLFATGIGFISLQFLDTFPTFCLGIFIIMIIADMFRPAIYVALNAYSSPENKTRSLTLIRLAINLGFSAGPAIGGLIIVSIGYYGLFWLDGITCILASLILMYILNPKHTVTAQQEVIINPKSPYKDGPFILFFLAMIFFSISFIQYFSTIPIYYKEIHLLSEFDIGLLLGLNGFLIFTLEMPLIKYLEKSNISKVTLILWGAALTGFSFLILNVLPWLSIIIIGMLLMTIGEMIAFPFSNAFALQRAQKGKTGEYMAFYSIAFSIAHIIGHNTGMRLVDSFGFTATWYVVSVLMGLCVLILFLLQYYLNREVSQ